MNQYDVDQYDDPLMQFLDGIPNSTTRDHYQRFIKYFFKFLKFDESSIQANAKIFSDHAKLDSKWATSAIMNFIRFQKQRVEKGEIVSVSISNYYKPIKLFCVMNDIILNWDKIAKTIPKAR